ncbi:hypothetical protein HanIR_Chr09g0400341 [Helianthus annuus]|nr:hypothetical protein HanIR_Chr09g0400341 [Helianthus annuus]
MVKAKANSSPLWIWDFFFNRFGFAAIGQRCDDPMNADLRVSGENSESQRVRLL